MRFILLLAIGLLTLVFFLAMIRMVKASSYTVTLNTTSGITEAQVRGWLSQAGHQEHTLLAEVRIVDEGYTSANVGGGCSEHGCFASPSSIQFNSANLLSNPQFAAAFEYGHVWNSYFRWAYWQGSFDPYLQARGLLGDPRVNSSFCWTPENLITEDYRQLFTQSNVARCDGFLGASDAWTVSGLRDWLALTFTHNNPPPGYFVTPTVTPTPTATPQSTSTPKPCRAKRCR